MSYKGKADKRLNVNQASKVVKEMVSNDSGCIIFRSHGIKRIKQRGNINLYKNIVVITAIVKGKG